MVKMEVAIEEQGYLVLFELPDTICHFACRLYHNNRNIYPNPDINHNDYCHLNSVYNNPDDSSADRNNNNDHRSDHHRTPDNDR